MTRKGQRVRASNSTDTTDSSSSLKPQFDATKLEGFIPIEESKNLQLPDFDENNPLHVAFAETLAGAIVRVKRRGADLPSETHPKDGETGP